MQRLAVTMAILTCCALVRGRSATRPASPVSSLKPRAFLGVNASLRLHTAARDPVAPEAQDKPQRTASRDGDNSAMPEIRSQISDGDTTKSSDQQGATETDHTQMNTAESSTSQETAKGFRQLRMGAGDTVVAEADAQAELSAEDSTEAEAIAAEAEGVEEAASESEYVQDSEQAQDLAQELEGASDQAGGQLGEGQGTGELESEEIATEEQGRTEAAEGDSSEAAEQAEEGAGEDDTAGEAESETGTESRFASARVGSGEALTEEAKEAVWAAEGEEGAPDVNPVDPKADVGMATCADNIANKEAYTTEIKFLEKMRNEIETGKSEAIEKHGYIGNIGKAYEGVNKGILMARASETKMTAATMVACGAGS